MGVMFDNIINWVKMFNSNQVIAIATVVYAFFTFLIIKQNHELISLNYLPFLQIYLEQDEIESNSIGLKIENIGKGIARNIHLTLVDGDNNIIKSLATTGIFQTGLKQLSPRRIIFLPDIVNLLGSSLLENASVLKIKIHYQDRKNKKISDIFELHFDYLKNFRCTRKPPEYKISKSLEAIEKSQEKIEKSLYKIASKVEVLVKDEKTLDFDKEDKIIAERTK
jgi:hypothetical protein